MIDLDQIGKDLAKDLAACEVNLLLDLDASDAFVLAAMLSVAARHPQVPEGAEAFTTHLLSAIASYFRAQQCDGVAALVAAFQLRQGHTQ